MSSRSGIGSVCRAVDLRFVKPPVFNRLAHYFTGKQLAISLLLRARIARASAAACKVEIDTRVNSKRSFIRSIDFNGLLLMLYGQFIVVVQIIGSYSQVIHSGL